MEGSVGDVQYLHRAERRGRGMQIWFEAAQAAPRLLLIWILLPMLGIQRLRRWTGARRRRTQVLPPERIAGRVIALRRVGARLPGCRCLARSMALSWWLNRSGQTHRLLIGVQGTAIDLRAHSWVEIEGQAVDDSPETIAGFRQISEI
jgi:hypothetical protein